MGERGLMLSNIFKKFLLGRWFAVEDGRIRLFGKMDWSIIHSHVFAMVLQEIGEDIGKEAMFKLGYDQGKEIALEMLKHMGLKIKGGWITQKAIVDVLDFIGFGRPKFVVSKVEKNGRHHVLFHIKDNPVIEHASRLFGNKSLVCSWFMGVYSAHGEFEWGMEKCRFKENRCICRGDHYCEWESKW